MITCFQVDWTKVYMFTTTMYTFMSLVMFAEHFTLFLFVKTGKIERIIHGHKGKVTGIECLDDLIITTSYDQHVRCYDAEVWLSCIFVLFVCIV